ncbi:EF-hand and coiled-coil domain-containing protein 1 [Melanotaenia boesemani]|uniref:EF-hand and coiled-coil domain-containing protein 1 n=1 Tax=Melanotaenia boesemani TaxID=1250792 RepID=UPI001C048B9E|nr:EF-hand and coiled-coil domain-containing protein 1 [Melanotaenia boesemani]
MKRTALAVPRVQPSPRPARKSEWLRSALAHHHCTDPGAENEVVVLATGIDQYLQEVFHHLAYRHQDDAVLAEDFTALCAVLGLPGAQRGQRTWKKEDGRGNGDEQEEEFRDVCSGLPDQLSFKDFHSRLCGYFRVRSAPRGTGECAWRLPVSDDTELVERQIRLRWPRVRRRKCVSFDLTRDPSRTTNRSTINRTLDDAREPDEVAALRELVEDLRSALQGSDARCLALEVALRREKSSTIPCPSCYSSAVSAPSSSITLAQGKLVPTHRLKGQLSGARGDGARRVQRRRDIRDPLLRELKLIRSSRDGQLEEAIKYNERLEEELQWAFREVHRLQGVESSLRKENAQIRRRAEEAREALSLGLQRVQLIQEQARSVPQLQSRITDLETELLQYRSRSTCLPPARPEDSSSKTGTDGECLQRAVEGRAASDEEEEDRGRKEGGQRCLLEVKQHICHLHGRGKGCQKDVVACQSLPHDKNRSSRDSRGCCSATRPSQEKLGGSRLENEMRPEDKEDRTKLSLLEDKFTDSLTLLLKLRNKNVSRRVLGKIVMDSLEACSRSGGGPSQVLQAADALCVHLSSSDVLRDSGEDGGGGEESGETPLAPPSGHPTSSINSRLISG